ncbi:MAG TPA: isoprenylcysteine carboxylmethyltransferase family protein [Thermoplasmata archaeon]|nr:isoprenylcysteine carboxylmethyltransferase family protein [Thermoplasmata archaeon]
MIPNPIDLVNTYRLEVALTAIGGVAWVAAEYYGRWSTWQQGAARKPPSTLDRGTYPAIALSIAVGMISTALAFLFGVGGLLPSWAAPLGLGLVAVGLLIRVWALRTLGRFFTMPITLRADHEIVQKGPYRWLRHPAYTGGFLTVVGMSIALGPWVGIAITVVGCLIAYVYRIQVEEATLLTRFGNDYRAYSATTWRLLPLVY